MIRAFDTYYTESRSKTVCLEFPAWDSSCATGVHQEIRDGVEPYVSGEFFRRELPCILSLWKLLPDVVPQAVVIDGFVHLDDEGRPGLGLHLYQALGAHIPVIGVAKTNFHHLDTLKLPVLRGSSKSPLFVTAVGVSLPDAGLWIQQMHGTFRMPTLLQELDRHTREDFATAPT